MFNLYRTFTILNWDIRLSTARRSWFEFKVYPSIDGYHIVWGKLSLMLTNWTLEVFPLCAECNSTDIGEVYSGDEGITRCDDCGAIEGGYRYVNLREYDKA